MADLEGARLWVIADSAIPALSDVQAILEQRGATVELLDLSEVVERIVRDRGESMLETLRDVFRRSPLAEVPEDADLDSALRHGPPHLLVVAGSRYLRGLDMVARMAGREAIKVALLTDFNLSGAWLKGAVSAFVVPHPKLVPVLLDSGFDERRIFVAGPPIDPRYESVPEREKLDETLHIDRSAGAVVLVLGSAFELSDLDRVVFQVSLVEGPMQAMFHAGDDPAHADVLRRAARKHGLVARMFGTVPNLQDFIAAADLVVAEVSDPQILGVLALDKPLILVGDPGPVTTQTDFLVAEGVVWHSDNALRLGADVELALRPERLTKMSEASVGVGRATGASEVAEALATIYLQRAELVADVSHPVELEPDPVGSPDVGPFELIGAPGAEPIASEQAGAVAAVGSPLSAAEAKDELAALIMAERDSERRLAEAQREQEQWRNRLELAREWNEDELAVEAERMLRSRVAECDRFGDELERVRAQKAKLKARVRRSGATPSAPSGEPPRGIEGMRRKGAAAGLDDRFRSIEVERDLTDLKERLRREMDS